MLKNMKQITTLIQIILVGTNICIHCVFFCGKKLEFQCSEIRLQKFNLF